MASPPRPVAMHATEAPLRARASGYPPDLLARVAGREKQPLGDQFGLTVFGVNLTRLRPGAWSALHHRHGAQDEFVYVLAGTPTLVTQEGETALSPGMCAGFPAGGSPHHLENRTASDVLILEVGDRGKGDSVEYPDDDLAAALQPDGSWRYTRKDGAPLG